MKHYGPYCNKERVTGPLDLSGHKDIRRERGKETDIQMETTPLPPLLGDKSAIRTRGHKSVMAEKLMSEVMWSCHLLLDWVIATVLT